MLAVPRLRCRAQAARQVGYYPGRRQHGIQIFFKKIFLQAHCDMLRHRTKMHPEVSLIIFCASGFAEPLRTVGDQGQKETPVTGQPGRCERRAY